MHEGDFDGPPPFRGLQTLDPGGGGGGGGAILPAVFDQEET